MRRDDVTSHMSLAEEQLRAFLDDFQFKDIPDLADSIRWLVLQVERKPQSFPWTKVRTFAHWDIDGLQLFQVYSSRN